MKKIIFSFIFGFSVFIGNTAPLLAVNFDSNAAFPGWKENDTTVQGVIGSNAAKKGEGVNPGDLPSELTTDDTKILLYFLPVVISFIFKVVTPIVIAMFIFSGLRFIYASGDEDELKRAKEFLVYGLIGVCVIALSYSIMKIVYFLLL